MQPRMDTGKAPWSEGYTVECLKNKECGNRYPDASFAYGRTEACEQR